MKYKLWLLMLVACVLAGCGNSPEGNGEPSETYSAGDESVEPDKADVDASESFEVKESETSESEKGEETPYVLTFEAKTIDGEAVTDAVFAESKLTMLNIWGTYCNPCLAEMPALGRIGASYDKADFQIMGIICDVQEGAGEEDINAAKALIEETGANYPHLLLNETLYNNLVGGTDAVPTTFLVNQKGEVLGYVVGANSEEGWVELIEQLLAEEQ